MIINRHRGEVAAQFDGKDFRLCLTLAALAELEARFGVEDMTALAERFATGRMSASDMLKIIGAGLRGAGHEISDSELGHMQIDGGATGYAQTVSQLLNATFGSPGETTGQGERR